MFRKFFTLIGTIGIIAGFVALILVMGEMRPKPERQEVVETAPVVFYEIARSQAVTLDVSAQGEVRPRTDIILTTQVAGKIIATSDQFVDGGAFEKGDLLVKIEDADYRAAVASANARVAQASEALKREEAEAVLAAEDFKELGIDGEANDLTLRKPQLAQARANYQATLADRRAAQLNLDRTEIRADFKGRVRQRTAGVGQFASPGAQLGRVFSTDVAEIRLALTDADLAKLGLPLAFTESENQPGPKVIMTATIAGGFHTWEGRIARTDGAIDPTTRQMSAITVVDDPYGAGSDNGTPLAMGLFVNALIEGKPYDNAFVLPRPALYGRDTMYVINDDDTLSERTVTVIAAGRDTVTISSGISDGEKVAASPLRGKGNGEKVMPSDPTATNSNTGIDEGQAIAGARPIGASQ